MPPPPRQISVGMLESVHRSTMYNNVSSLVWYRLIPFASSEANNLIIVYSSRDVILVVEKKMLSNDKFQAQSLTGDPTVNWRCHALASHALNIYCSFGQSARSIESRCVVEGHIFRYPTVYGTEPRVGGCVCRWIRYLFAAKLLSKTTH